MLQLSTKGEDLAQFKNDSGEKEAPEPEATSMQLRGDRALPEQSRVNKRKRVVAGLRGCQLVSTNKENKGTALP
jgi:hypothetical protein